MQNKKLLFICSFICASVINSIFTQSVPAQSALTLGQPLPGSQLPVKLPTSLVPKPPSATGPISNLPPPVPGLPPSSQQIPLTLEAPKATPGLPQSLAVNAGQKQPPNAILGQLKPPMPIPGQPLGSTLNSGLPQPPGINSGQPLSTIPIQGQSQPSAPLLGQLPKSTIPIQGQSQPSAPLLGQLPKSTISIQGQSQPSAPLLGQLPKSTPNSELIQGPPADLGKKPPQNPALGQLQPPASIPGMLQMSAPIPGLAQPPKIIPGQLQPPGPIGLQDAKVPLPGPIALAPNQSPLLKKPPAAISTPEISPPQIPNSMSKPSPALPAPNPVPSPPLAASQQPGVPPYSQLPPDLFQAYLAKLTELEAAREKLAKEKAAKLNQTPQQLALINQSKTQGINQNNDLAMDQPSASEMNQQKAATINQQNILAVNKSVPAINQQNILTLNPPNANTNQLNAAQIQPNLTQNEIDFLEKFKSQLKQPSSAEKQMEDQPKSFSTGIQNPATLATKPLLPGAAPASLLQPGIAQTGLAQPAMGQAGLQKPAIEQPNLLQPPVAPTGLLQPAIDQSAAQVQPTSLVQLYKVCGVPFSRAFETRIVGGTEAELDSWPWMVAIFLNERFDYVACAGALITNQFVLTAAHCMLDAETHKLKNKSDYTIRLGEHDFSRSDDGAFPVDHKVMKLIPFPEYDPIHKLRDIGLIQLSTVVSFTESIIPVCLPSSPELVNTSFYAKRAHIVGWGFTAYGTYSNYILRNATVRVTQLWKCIAIYNQFNYTVDNTQICAGNNKIPIDVCQGDSGGPLVIEDSKNRMNVIGVISYGVRCAQEGFPGVYTKVSHYLQWVKKEANII